MELVRADSACSGLNYVDEDEETTLGNLWSVLEKINRVRGTATNPRSSAAPL